MERSTVSPNCTDGVLASPLWLCHLWRIQMTRIEQLEHDIRSLSRSELLALGEWFQDYFAEEWDKQIEADAKAGKLDRLARQALNDHQAGRTRPL